MLGQTNSDGHFNPAQLRQNADGDGCHYKVSYKIIHENYQLDDMLILQSSQTPEPHSKGFTLLNHTAAATYDENPIFLT